MSPTASLDTAAPVLNWDALTPVLLILGAGVLGVLVEAFLTRRARLLVQAVLSLSAILASGVFLYLRWESVKTAGAAAVADPQYQVSEGFLPGAQMSAGLTEDSFSIAAQAILLVIGLLAVLVMADRTAVGDGAFAAQAADRPGSAEETESLHAGWTTTEVFPLTLFSLGGMMLFGASSDLITLFVILEMISLPLYILAATARHRRLLSQEAALKYFVLGAFASAFLLMGSALLYGVAGAVDYKSLAEAVSTVQGQDWLILAGLMLAIVGLLFKVAAVPFHAWSPDVYQGAPTPVTGFMAAGVKAAAFLALVRFYYVIAGAMGWDLAPALWAVAALTMLVGTVVGVVQRDVKRMLAYSAIAHAGFMLIGILAYSTAAISALGFYALTYGIATVGAFGIITLVRSNRGGSVGGEDGDLDAFKGMGRRNPWAAGAMTVFLLSFAGVPLTAGFMAKFRLFAAGLSGNGVPFVVLAVVCSAVTAFFYMRLIVLMFFHEPDGERSVVVASNGPIALAVGVAVMATIGLGILPQTAFDLFDRTAMLLP